jgi:hypothetical protein
MPRLDYDGVEHVCQHLNDNYMSEFCLKCVLNGYFLLFVDAIRYDCGAGRCLIDVMRK